MLFFWLTRVLRGKNIQLGRVGCNYGKLLIFIDIYFVSLRIVSDKSMSRGFLRKSSVNTFIGIVWILFAVSASAQNAVSKFRADSIRQSLSCIQKPQDKIPLLKELIGLYWQLPEEVPALKEIIDIAMPLDSIGIVYDAMAGLSRYYYNVENRDSLLYWVGQLDRWPQKGMRVPEGCFYPVAWFVRIIYGPAIMSWLWTRPCNIWIWPGKVRTITACYGLIAI